MGEFAAAAARLSGFAGMLLGWRPEEFWEATPAELSAVVAAMSGEATVMNLDEIARLRRMLGESVDG